MPRPKKGSDPQPPSAADGRHEKPAAKPRPVSSVEKRPFFSTHRVLAIVLAAATIFGSYEFFNDNVTERTKPESYLSPEHNYVDVVSEIYPNRSNTRYHHACQAILCTTPDLTTSVCDKYRYRDPDWIRNEMEEAIAIGDTGNEMFYYGFARILIVQRASEPEIEDAIQSWHAHFPYSKRPDPRLLYRSSPRRGAQMSNERENSVPQTTVYPR